MKNSTTASKPSASVIAARIIDVAEANGFRVSVSGGILSISRQFAPGDAQAFRECDMSYYDVLSLLPRTSPGSDWGTDGGGIGGMVALKSGAFKMNRSGGSKLVLAAIANRLSTH